MTHRPEFSAATKRQALERSAGPDGQPRCQDPLCGISVEHVELWVDLNGAEIYSVNVLPRWTRQGDGITQAELIALRDAILSARFKHAKVLRPIIRKFKLDGGALLEVDHAQECADGGDNDLGNAVVRCVFCHYFKTQDRANTRRRAPKKQARTFPEQLDVIKTAKVEGLRQLVAAKMGPACGAAPTAGGQGESAPASGVHPRERRHTSERQFLEAVQRREAAIEDNWFGA